jgi:Protein of unknown function (DUF4232)
MRPAKIIATVLFTAAVAVTGCTARSTVAHPPAAPETPVTAPSTPQPQPPDRPAIRRCDTSALRGSVHGSEGAAGTIWTTIQLRNVSAGTCTVKGIPDVRLLGANGQPVTPASKPDGPGGSLVILRPGAAALFAFAAANGCDSLVAGSRIRVTPTPGRNALVVQLGGGLISTCRTLRVQALAPAGASMIADGRHPVLLKTVDPAQAKITFDLIQFYQGDDATREAAKDHQESPPPNDHYIRNVSPRLRTLDVRADAAITANGLLDTQQSTPVTLAKLASLTRAPSPVFWVTVRDDQVVKIAEQWLP